MSDRWEFRNLGRQVTASRNPGMWPYGEPEAIRARYDAILRGDIIAGGMVTEAGTTTKVCYNCGGSGMKGGKECTACHRSGSVPAAR